MIKKHYHIPFMIAKDYLELLARHHTGKLNLQEPDLAKTLRQLQTEAAPV